MYFQVGVIELADELKEKNQYVEKFGGSGGGLIIEMKRSQERALFGWVEVKEEPRFNYIKGKL